MAKMQRRTRWRAIRKLFWITGIAYGHVLQNILYYWIHFDWSGAMASPPFLTPSPSSSKKWRRPTNGLRKINSKLYYVKRLTNNLTTILCNFYVTAEFCYSPANPTQIRMQQFMSLNWTSSHRFLSRIDFSWTLNSLCKLFGWLVFAIRIC